MSTSAQAEGRESARGSIARNDQGSRRASTAGTRGRGDGRTTDGLSNALGWFSVGLGLAQIVSPGSVARLIGVRDDDRNRRIMRAVGMRELASGVGIFAKDRPAEFLWGRVAGDLMDLAMLGNALSGDGNERPRTSIAIAAVLGVGALTTDFLRGMAQV